MVDHGLIGYLANIIGCTEAALRLLISLFVGYPIAFFHRKFLYGKSPFLQHVYFITAGLLIGYYNYGSDILHALAAVTVSYVILKVLGGGILSLLLVFFYAMTHLLVGYWVTATQTYDIKWTMPHCVLTLRLIGLAFNVYDGSFPKDKLSKENQLVALEKVPSILEVLAHSFFPAAFLIGPQFPLKKYKDFVELKLEKKENPQELPKSVAPGLYCFSMGFFYLVVYQLGSSIITDNFMTSADFATIPIWKQYLFLGIWGRCALYKYISCWLITEGACTVLGLTYNGTDKDGMAKWDGCSNVKMTVFEGATKMDHYIESFNINTNHWVAQYIYKRLKFLNNKTYSQFGVLLFLAIWHGFHSGYYATFFFEFITILAEKNLQDMLERNETVLGVLKAGPMSWITYVFLRLYTFLCMGYAMIPFILLTYDKYMPLYRQFYFSFHIYNLFMIFLAPVLKKYVIRPKKRSESSASIATTSNPVREKRE